MDKESLLKYIRGGDVAKYFLSAGMQNSDALYKESGLNDYNTNVKYNKYTFRSNLDVNVTKSTTLTLGVDGYITKQNRPGVEKTDDIWVAHSAINSLTVPLQYSTGEFPIYNGYVSPYVLLNHTGYVTDHRNTFQVNFQVKQDFSQWVDGLSARVLYSFDTYSQHWVHRTKMPDLYYVDKRKVNGQLDLEHKQEKQSLDITSTSLTNRKHYLEAAIDYNKLFADKHRLGALLHYFHQEYNSTEYSGMDAIPQRNQGVSGRVSYSFEDTYFVEGNFGYTGSENFQRGEQFGFFPSIALGWVPTAYEWVNNTFPIISFMKLRYSYGIAGNDKISNYRFPYFTFVEQGTGGAWGGKGTITETRLGADNLKWEKAIKQNYGLDINFLNNRVEFIFDFFKDKREGIFQKRTNLPETVGHIADPYGNVGTMESKGFDATGSYTHPFGKGNWFTIRGNFTYTHNEVTHWEEPPFKYAYRGKEGHIYNAQKGLLALGLFKDEDDVKSSPTQFGTVLPGDIKYKDINGDGRVDDEDEIYFNYSDVPKIIYGLAGEVGYKNWTLSIFFQGAAKSNFFYQNDFYPFKGGRGGNVLDIVNKQSNRWTPAEYSGDPSTENSNARFPRLSYGESANNNRNSSFWLGRSDFIRLKTMELSYRLRLPILKNIAIDYIDLSLLGDNLYVWDDVETWDPEQVKYNGTVYPLQRKITFNLSINF